MATIQRACVIAGLTRNDSFWGEMCPLAYQTQIFTDFYSARNIPLKTNNQLNVIRIKPIK